MDERLLQPPIMYELNEEEPSTHSPEEREHFPFLGEGGLRLPLSFVIRRMTRLHLVKLPDPEHEEESDDEVIQQPIPFQMGVTPMPEEGETNDELQTWYEGKEEMEPQARGSTDPVPKSFPKPNQNLL